MSSLGVTNLYIIYFLRMMIWSFFAVLIYQTRVCCCSWLERQWIRRLKRALLVQQQGQHHNNYNSDDEDKEDYHVRKDHDYMTIVNRRLNHAHCSKLRSFLFSTIHVQLNMILSTLCQMLFFWKILYTSLVVYYRYSIFVTTFLWRQTYASKKKWEKP